MGDMKIFILRDSNSRINKFDSKKPYEKVYGAFVRQVTIILLVVFIMMAKTDRPGFRFSPF